MEAGGQTEPSWSHVAGWTRRKKRVCRIDLCGTRGAREARFKRFLYRSGTKPLSGRTRFIGEVVLRPGEVQVAIRLPDSGASLDVLAAYQAQ